ncbi:MAG TPA: trypsin-like peptidase domain-containing protein [Acidimicrobiales bacterium]|nr:trypsin-like peptidase domain-containing protein [Acidimicrobiales bacterium]
MSDFNDAPPSGEPQEPSWAQGSWTPPPPPPDWREPGPGWRDQGPGWHPPAQGWHEPGPGWNDPRYGGWGAPGQGGQGGQGGPPPGYHYWGSPYQGGWGPGGPRGWGYGWAPPRPRRSLPHAVTALLLVVAVLVGLGIGHGVWRSVHNSVGSGASGGGNNFGVNPFGLGNGNGGSNGSGSNPGGALSGAAATVSNELVDINTSLSYQNGEAAGTGIVLTSDGVILTNNHVISGATTVKATDIGNGRTYTADVIGYDRIHDVAVIKLQNASGLKTADIGDSSKVSVGDAVVGLGNAGGVGGTPSTAAGQVLALNQSITAQDTSNGTSEKLTGLIETDANIQPGDSGGALIDRSGKVIGMDTAASTGFSFQTQGNQGFAIPINSAMGIANQIRAGKASNTVHIGATAFLGVEVDTSQQAANTQGAVISGAIPNGPAAAAGIARGDVITSLGGSPVDSANALTNLISRYHPGDKVPVQWTDPNGGTHTATLTLAHGPAA